MRDGTKLKNLEDSKYSSSSQLTAGDATPLAALQLFLGGSMLYATEDLPPFNRSCDGIDSLFFAVCRSSLVDRVMSCNIFLSL